MKSVKYIVDFVFLRGGHFKMMGRVEHFVSRIFRPVKCPNCCGHDMSIT